MKMRQLSSVEINQVSGAVLDLCDPEIAERYWSFPKKLAEMAREIDPTKDYRYVTMTDPSLRRLFVGWVNRGGGDGEASVALNLRDFAPN